MRKEVAGFRAEAERWNAPGTAWWLADLRDDPLHIICSEEMSDLFNLDATQAKHSLLDIFQHVELTPGRLIGENPNQSPFFDINRLGSNPSDTSSLTFKWRGSPNQGYQLFSNHLRVIERSPEGAVEVLFGILEDVTCSSAQTFEALFQRQFDEMVDDFGFGYRWIVDLDNMLILPDRAMAMLHGHGWVAGQWYPCSGIYDWTPQAYWQQVKEDTDNYRRLINAGEKAELNVTHPHIHSQTGELHWYNIRGKYIPLNGRNFSVGFAVDTTEYHNQKNLLAEHLERQELLSSSAEIAQWQFDPATGMLHYDELYCRWLNTGLKAFEPCGMDQVMSTMTLEQQQSFMADVERGLDLVMTQRCCDEYVWDHYVWDRIVRAIAKRSESDGKEVVFGYAIDVTDVVSAKLEAQKLHSRLQSIAEAAKMGVFEYDLINETLNCNAAFREIYDLPLETYPQITLEHVEGRWDPAKAKSYRVVRDSALAGTAFETQERTLRRSDGSLRHVSVVVEGEYAGQRLVRINGIVIDHTDDILKQAQLEEMVCEREEMLKKQQQMFAIIGHELRTPVAAVQMVLQDDTSDTDEKLVQLADISDGLLNVLDDLRLVSEPNRRDKPERKTTDPNRVIQAALASLKAVLHEHSISAHFSADQACLPLLVPVQSLRQVVTNLAKNAALHSGGKNIYVSLEFSETPFSGLLATLRVEDDGKGIPAAERSRLFEAFERGKSEQDGSGLGLYIVRTLATKMEGAVSCTSSRYGGACFSLTFPVTLSERVAKGEERTANLMLDGMRILIAEDEATLRLLTERMLSKHGAQVTVAENGLQALDLYDSGQFDLLLTDMMMPQMGGVELIAEIRKRSPDLPIIAVTAAVLGSQSQQLIAAGADAVVAKPITATVLLNTLESVIAN